MGGTHYTQLRKSEENENELSQYSVFVEKENSEYRKRHIFSYTLLVTSSLVFFSLWLISANKAASDQASCVRPQLVSSPATQVLRYEKKRLWRDIDGPNPFTGQPRVELDKAWHNLLEPMTIKVSADELSQFSESDSSIALKDGSGYIAEMAVYHELHCNKRIRRALSFDYYYPNMTEEDRATENLHIDHCLEYWRESVMCRRDVTLGTFYWRRSDGFPTSRVYTDNECVDWTALDTWARKRMVDMTNRDQLVPAV